MKGKLVMCLALLLLCVGYANAQTRTVTGKVVSSEDGEAVVGASVLVVGTGKGVATNIEGNFSLSNVPAAAKQLRVSYMGMKTQTVAIKSGRMVVTLEPDVDDLDEFIVTGYGTTRREAKTGSIAVVASDKIAEIPASSVDKVLAGKMAGVMVTQSSGQPGSNSQIRIRGISSINAGNEPLYVVDGIPVMSGDQSYFTNSNNAISMINPNDIESVTLLKDAASASIYGSRAANGVILITTKSGKEGKSTIGVRAKYGVSSLANDNDFGVMNSAQLLSYQRQAVINAGMNPDDPTCKYYLPLEILSRRQYNPMDEFTRLGQMQEYEINLSGGTSKSTYYSSLSYHDNEGVFYGYGFKRFQARVNADYEINKKWKTGARVNAGYMSTDDVPTDAMYYANPVFAGMNILPWTPLRNEDGTWNSNIPENSNTNPRATAAYDDQWEKQYRFNGSTYLECKPIKGLTLKSNNAAEMTFNEGRRYWSLEANDYSTGYPKLQTSQTQYQLLTTSNTVTYDGHLDKHSYRILGGQEASYNHYHYNYGMSDNLNPDIPYHNTGDPTSKKLSYSESTSTLMSYFGILDYSYDSRYYLQGSLRYDGSSRFGKNNQWGLFYSLGLSWNINNEKFMESVDWVDMLKLRASYGVNGNNDIGNYGQYGVYSTAVYNGVSSLIPSSPANDDLSWEKNTSWNIGIDFNLLQRINGSIDWYTRKTTDMLLYKSLPRESGFSSALQNIGSMRNSGIELQIDVDILNSKNWHWNVGFNIAHNTSKILDLGDDEMLSAGDTPLKYIVGESIYTFYLRDYYGVNPVNGEALWRTADGTISNDINDAQYIKAGSPEPEYTGGVNTTLSWKDLSLSVACEFKGGNDVMIGERGNFTSDGNTLTMNQFKSALNYWQKPGDTGCNPKPVADNPSRSYALYSTRFLEKGDYFRIKDITLAYNLPREIIKKAGLKAAKLYTSGLNVYTFHDVDFWDPERGVDGYGTATYPVCKSFIVGLDLTF